MQNSLLSTSDSSEIRSLVIYHTEQQAMTDLPIKLGASFTKDGNQYCWLFGDDLQAGIAGFGETAEKATRDFWLNWHNQKA